MLYVEGETPESVGDCDWCSFPVFEDEEYTEGNGGSGVMHCDCAAALSNEG